MRDLVQSVPAIKRCLLGILAGCSLLCLPVQAQPVADWTVMVYMDADCDLEAPQMDDLREMLAVPLNARVNVVALVDRSVQGEEADGYTNQGLGGLPNWTSARLLKLEKGKLVQLEDWGEQNMSGPAPLQRLLSSVPTRFPAKHLALIFSDHGASWPGACNDETAKGDADALTLPEIVSALTATSSAYGKLELIGFDCCLMGNFEVASSLSGFAHYLVASEELEPGSGWSYTNSLKALLARPEQSGAEWGSCIARDFQDSFDRSSDPETRNEGVGVTLSVIDLSQLEGLRQALDRLGRAALARLNAGEGWSELARVRSDAEEYGRHGNPKEPGSAVHDLGHLCSLISAQSSDATLKASAAEVLGALKAVVVRSIHGKGCPQATGLSLFFAPDSAALNEAQPGTYAQVPGLIPSWHQFLQSYTSVADKDSQPIDIPVLQASATTVSGQHPVVISTHLASTADLDEAYFVIAQPLGESEQMILGTLPSQPDSQGILSEEWDGSWFFLGKQKAEILCPITSSEELSEHETLVTIPAQIQLPQSKVWQEVTLHMLLRETAKTFQGELVYVMLDEGFAPRQLQIRPGTRLRAEYLTVNAKGEEGVSVSDDPADILTVNSAADLVLNIDFVDPGDYLAGFMAIDLAGNVAEEYLPVKVAP